MFSKEILTEIQRKNHVVFKRLFEDVYQELVGHANEYLFDSGLSEDVVQEVFVQLWEKSNSIHLKTNLKAYLYAMVRNRCLNMLKVVKITDRSKMLEQEVSANLKYTPEWHLEEDKNARYKKVQYVLAHLPAKMKKIVMLRFINNYRYKEIAEELGVSTNTVKTQLKRARLKFDELIAVVVFFFLNTY